MSSQAHKSQVCLSRTTDDRLNHDSGHRRADRGGERGEVGEGEREKRGRKREEGEEEEEGGEREGGRGRGREREEERESESV